MTGLVRLGEVATSARQASGELNRLKKAGQDLEASFLKDLMEKMKVFVPTHEGDNYGGDILNGLFSDAVSQALARQEPLGIGRMVDRTMASQVLNQYEAKRIVAAKAETKPAIRTDSIDTPQRLVRPDSLFERNK